MESNVSTGEQATTGVQRRVLVIDDEAAIRMLFEQVLEDDVGPITLATTAEEGLAAAATMPELAVVLVDKNLPDRSGLELMRELRATRPDVALILMTGYASMGSAIDAIDAGALHYLTKPFDDVQEIRLMVLRALERHQLERELGAARERYERLFNVSPDAVIVYDVETGRVTDANKSACTLYGYDREELIGLSPGDLAMPSGEGYESWNQKRITLVRGLSRRRDRTRDGTPLEVEAALASFTDGGREYLMEVIRDTTAQVRAEHERMQLEDQLGEAQRMEPLGRLTAGVAHDFNNLLGIVLVCSELIAHGLRGVKDERAEEAIIDANDVVEAVQSGSWLTRQLLAFGKPRSVSPEPTDVNQAVGAITRLIRRMVDASVEIDRELSPAAGVVEIDPGHLDQILINLAVNARDAMPTGGRLVFSTDRDGDAVRPVQIHVSDTGTGMSPEMAARAFDAFFTTKSAHGGTGLGLSTVKMLVERAGGNVTVASTPGVGSRFTLSFPASDLAAASADIEVPLERLYGDGESVLLVDDNNQLRRLLRRVLERARYNVLEASRSDEAVHQLRRHRESVLVAIVDVSLPGANGVAVVERLRKVHPTMRVIYISGGAGDDAMERVASDEFASFLAKPFGEVQLLLKLRNALRAALI